VERRRGRGQGLDKRSLVGREAKERGEERVMTSRYLTKTHRGPRCLVSSANQRVFVVKAVQDVAGGNESRSR